jgi:prepilin-type N-terminal cleavage/methylation domain-containing protein
MKTKGKHRAFTLIEVLVATGITAILGTLMISVISTTMGVWNRSIGALTAEAQARLVMDTIARDIENTVRRDHITWFAVDCINMEQPSFANWKSSRPPPPMSDLNLLSVNGNAAQTTFTAGYRFMNYNTAPTVDAQYSGAWLRFLSNVSEGGKSDDPKKIAAPRAVSYYKKIHTVGGERVYRLYRHELDPQQTFNLPGGGDLRDVAFETLSPDASRRDDLIADNVIDFGVRVFTDPPDTKTTLLFPYNTAAQNYRNDPDAPEKAPAYVDVYLRILTDDGVKQLEALEKGRLTLPAVNGMNDYEQTIRFQSKEFVRRVKIKSEGF